MFEVFLTVNRGWYFKDYFDQPSRATIGTIVAILEVGALISSLLVGRIGDLIGRRKTILYGSIVFFIGGAFQTFATGVPMMMVGRIIAGLGVGALSTIVPVYQSEISVGPRSNLPMLNESLPDFCKASTQPRKAGVHRVHWEYFGIRHQRLGRLFL